MRISKKINAYFSYIEIILWLSSAFLITFSFYIFDKINYISLIASLIGITAIIFNAKANPFGQFLMIIFSFLYGIISFSFKYYGEMITYIGMTMPMAAFALVSWLRHPYKGNKAEVEINRIDKKEIVFMLLISIIITVIFYHILVKFHTSNIYPSTLSITTSFIAVYLTFRRNPYFSIAYAANDVVLIILWTLASTENIKYISVVICFTAFLFNDIYGFISWIRLEKMQKIDIGANQYGKRKKP